GSRQRPIITAHEILRCGSVARTPNQARQSAEQGATVVTGRWLSRRSRLSGSIVYHWFAFVPFTLPSHSTRRSKSSFVMLAPRAFICTEMTRHSSGLYLEFITRSKL